MAKTSVTMKDDVVVTRHQYEPMGVNHELQNVITKVMHEVVLDKGTKTLSELGYLHMSSIAFVKDHLEVKVYFAPELATKVVKHINNNGTTIPNPDLNIFQGYLFVGDVKDNVAFVNMAAPKYKIEENNRNVPAVVVKEKKREDTELMVVYCNLDLILAAYHDIDPNTDGFAVNYSTVGNSADNDEGDHGIMISMGVNQEFPVRVIAEVPSKVGYSVGYEPDQAIPYLLAKMNAVREAKKTKKELAHQVSDKAEQIVKEKDKENNFWKKFR